MFEPPFFYARRAALRCAVALGAAHVAGCAIHLNPNRYGDDVLPEKSLPPSLAQRLADITQDERHPLASLAVAVVHRGETFTGAWGTRHVPTQAVATARTLYRVASISKLLVSLCVMRLVEKGRLDLDEDISSALGYSLRNPSFPTVAITLRQLLSHTASLRDTAGTYWPEPTRLRDILLHEKTCWSTRHPPGAFFEYANLPWGVVAEVIENTTQTRFDRIMALEVFEPLGLEGGFDPALMPEALRARVATLYRKRTMPGDVEVWNPNGPWVAQVDDLVASPPQARVSLAYRPGHNGSVFAPQGGARVSVLGLAGVIQMLLGQGTWQGKTYLSRQSIEQMMSVQWARASGGPGGDDRRYFNAWGLGLQRFTDHSAPGVGDRLGEASGLTGWGHLGNAWGLTSALVVNPERAFGFAYAIGGVGFNPTLTPARFSAFHRHEERIMQAIRDTFSV